MKKKTSTSELAKTVCSPVKITMVAAAVSLLGACTTPAPLPPPPPPPPAQVAERIPYRPLPPGGASYVMQMPEKDQYGQRMTIISGVSDDEQVWHFRSAWNVAALNCTAPQYQPILTAYSAYISDHARGLKRVNDRIERNYRNKMGARRAGILEREERMTAVYNYFALPPARAGFCRAALDVSNRALAAPPSDPVAFANENFDLLTAPFEAFFSDYEQYQNLSARWDAEYGDRYGASQPGWVAVQEARRNGVVVPSAESDPASTLAEPTSAVGAVSDHATGADVPVVPVEENFVSQPVTQPVVSDAQGSGSS
ncbi:hypothetical protein [uncultured Erythrobacter sp.]|uniref:hypothetical protein n=1 Tax=uncultured Erythrobacter sp. TaxID=263913 RepID=UPI00260C9D21|nr:hypothetical protein [uncultured Erythrobacter sp.]